MINKILNLPDPWSVDPKDLFSRQTNIAMNEMGSAGFLRKIDY